MNRRVLLWGGLLALLAVFIAGIQGSLADQSGQITGRFKTVEVTVTQYIWELVSNRDGHVICQIIVEHPNRPSNDEAIQICGDQIFPPETLPTPFGATATPATATPTAPVGTPTPFDLSEFFGNVSWRFVTSRQFTRTVQVPIPEMILNLTIPPNQQQEPFFVRLTAYEPVYGERITGISGNLNGESFTCPSNRCDVPIVTGSVLEFWATSSLGDESKHVQAALRIDRTQGGAKLVLDSLQPLVLFQDACANIWGISPGSRPAWATFPPSPEDLHTLKPYQYLAGRLIEAGYVNAKDCPGGGLYASGAPNACGLEKAGSTVIDWQNQYDPVIWETGRSLGILPQLLKVLFEQESQFWPGNSRFAAYEYGLGQLSPTGADVAMRWDNSLFNTVCNGLLYDCSQVYGRLPGYAQATLRGSMVSSLDALCPTCAHGLDLSRAYESIPIFARTLRSNCYQVKYVMDQRGISAGYEDLWHFTFISYHSGYQCLAEALDVALYNDQPIDWQHVEPLLTCPGSRVYIRDLWNSFQAFSQNVIKPVQITAPTVQPTFQPTGTPVPVITTPTPTPVVAMSHVLVLVYVDTNGNNYPDPGERVNGVKVTATFSNNQVITATTANGEATFDLTGRTVGEDVLISLPELFRTQRIRVLQDGEIPVTFRLEEPVVPPVLP